MKFVLCVRPGAAHFVLIDNFPCSSNRLGIGLLYILDTDSGVISVTLKTKGDSLHISRKDNSSTMTLPGDGLFLIGPSSTITPATLGFQRGKPTSGPSPIPFQDRSQHRFQNRNRRRNVGVSRSLCDSSFDSVKSAVAGCARCSSVSAEPRTPLPKSDA